MSLQDASLPAMQANTNMSAAVVGFTDIERQNAGAVWRINYPAQTDIGYTVRKTLYCEGFFFKCL